MTKKNKIIVSITGITLVLLILVGLTYAYFLTRINGNTNTKSISVTTADLALTYGDGNGEIGQEKIKPGTVIGTKTFTVENTGNATTEYGVFLESVINELVRTQDAVIRMTCTSSVANKTCNGYSDAMPYQNDLLTTNSIDVDEVQTYELTLEYVEAGIDQSVDMNKELSGKIQIYDLNNTVDLAGVITDYNPGDYVVVNSEPKESQIRSDGSYKVVGLTPDNHTVTVYNSNKTQKYTKSLTITKGDTESTSGTNITISDTTRTILTSVSSNGLAVNSLDIYSPFESGTLANAIYTNSVKVTDEQKTLLYAEYSENPKTKPAAEISGANESTLSKTQDDYGDSYYFRGNVANNYLDFAGMCWRIVRIEGDGSIKIILEDSSKECDDAEFTGNWTVGDSVKFGYDSNNKVDFLNYIGGLADALKSYQIILNTKIDTTYTDTSLEDYLKIDEWCYDHNVTALNDDGEDYGAYTRIISNKRPSNICTGTKISKYKNNTTSMYVGILTADEVTFAGGIFRSNNKNYYLFNNYMYSEFISSWTFSPINWSYSMNSDVILYVSNDGMLDFDTVVDAGVSVRPAVTLKSRAEISSGDGSQSNPYVIN